jgi:hypothetical protein
MPDYIWGALAVHVRRHVERLLRRQRPRTRRRHIPEHKSGHVFYPVHAGPVVKRFRTPERSDGRADAVPLGAVTRGALGREYRSSSLRIAAPGWKFRQTTAGRLGAAIIPRG